MDTDTDVDLPDKKSGANATRNSSITNSKGTYLTPKIVLRHLQRISPAIENDKEASAISSINKYTVSNILSKYSFTSGVDPLFVQSMFTYIKKSDAAVPEFAVNLPFKSCSDLLAARVSTCTEFILMRLLG